VRANVKSQRFEHILRVAKLAREIALANDIDPDRTYLAGILHDLARDLSNEELLRLAPPESEMDSQHPLTVHGRAARAILEAEGFDDTDILVAVEDHVTGPRSGNRMAMAVYVADVSEPGRGVNHHIRELALVNLERAFNESIACKVRYLERNNKPVHPRTRAAFERLVREGHLLPDANCDQVTSRAQSMPLESRSEVQNRDRA
jgi:predicted HD superfamily hydrolase involved in NAD metabolism